MGGPKERVIIPKSDLVYYADDGTASVVLEDEFDPDYKPPHSQVLDYANWLGMEINQDSQLTWIAEEGLKAPLPDNWRQCKTDTADLYYFNFQTGESIWDHPLDEQFKALYKRENKKRREGKPFKKGPDDETYEFIHGHPPKKDRKKKEKGEKGALPDTLSRALSQATEKNDVKVGNTLEKGGLKKNKFGAGLPAPLATTGDPISASALGRTALPVLRKGIDADGPTSAPLTMRGLKSVQGNLSGSIISKPEEIGPDQTAIRKAENELKKEIDKIRDKYQEIEEQEKLTHEAQKRRMKHEYQKEIEDLELQMDTLKSTSRRKNTAKQNEWESELQERRRKYEGEISEKYESWRANQQLLQDQSRKQLEVEKQRKIKQLTASKEERLSDIKRQSETKALHDQEQELEDLRIRNKKELTRLREEQEETLTTARSTTDVDKQKLQADLLKQISSLKETHEQESSALLAEAEKRQREMTSEKQNLEDIITTKQSDLQELTTQLQNDKNLSNEGRSLSSMSLPSDRLDEEIAASRLQHEQRASKLKELEVIQEQLKEKRTRLESDIASQVTTLNDLNSEMKRQQDLILSRKDSNLNSTQQLEQEIASLRQVADDKSSQLDNDLQLKQQDLSQRLLTLEEETQRQESLLKKQITAAEQTHKKQLADLEKSIELEGEQKLDDILKEHKERISAEKKRLEEETENHIKNYAEESSRLINQRRQEEELRIADEISRLQDASLAEKETLLESSSNTHMEEERKATEAKIEAFRKEQTDAFQKVISELQKQASEREAVEREHVESEMKLRLADFQNMEQEKLDIALRTAADAAENSIKEVEKRLADELERNTATHQRFQDLTNAIPAVKPVRKEPTLKSQAPPPPLENISLPSDNDSDAILQPYIKRAEKEHEAKSRNTRRTQPKPYKDNRPSPGYEALRQAKHYLKRQKRELKARQVYLDVFFF